MVSRRAIQRPRAAICGLLVAFALMPAPALAQPAQETTQATKEPTKEELAAARALFEQALALEGEEQWAEALAKLETVGKVKMTPQVRFHIALCQEHLGRLVDAINGFELAIQEARAMGTKAQDVLDAAPPRAEKLRARVAQLTFVIDGTVRTSKLFIDGREVSLALAGTKIPVDPGERVIEVRRDDEVVERHELVFDEGEPQEITLHIDDPEPPPPPEPEPPPPEPEPIAPPLPPEDESVRIPAYVVGGVGIAGLAVAGALFGLREKTIDEVSCRGPEAYTGCDPDDEPLVEEARRYDVASKVMLGVGSAALATGVVLWFVLAPEDPAPKTGATQAIVDIGPQGAYGAIRIALP